MHQLKNDSHRPADKKIRRRWMLPIVLMAILVASSGCESCGSDSGPEPKDGTDAGLSTSLDAGSSEGEREVGDVPASAENADPVIQPVGRHESTPASVSVEFALPLIDDAPRAASDASDFTIEPEIPGELRFTGASSLSFQPSVPFRPATTYTITLRSIESKDGKLTPAKPWVETFTTPSFSFLGVSGAALDEEAGKVYVDLKFSAPIDHDALSKFAKWYVDGTPVSASYAAGGDRDVTNAVVVAPNVAITSDVRVVIEPGLPFAGDPELEAEGGEAKVNLAAGPSVEVFAATRKEGPRGFYIEVVCRDDSAPGGTRWYWNRESRQDYRISRRCLPTDGSAKTRISVHPAVKFEVAPGRGGFNLIGDFSRGTYSVSIDAGLQTIDGGLVKTGFERKVTVPTRSPNLEFVNKGRYIPRSMWNKVALKHLNAPEVDVIVRHIPQRNVVHWLNQSDEDAGRAVADTVAKERLTLEGDEDKSSTSMLDIANYIGKPEPGVYEVDVRTRQSNDQIRLLMTDMNLIVKTSEPKPGETWSEETYVWATDMRSAKPIPGVTIEAIRRSGTSIATCTSDASGFCQLAIPPKTIDDNGPFAVLARKGEDFTYLAYDELKTDVGSADVHGEKYLSDAAYRAAIYSDRDLYRPAETAHFVAIIRDRNHLAPNAGVPVELALRDPRGQEVRRETLRTNQAGVITLDQTFGDFASTGPYQVELFVAKRSIGTYRLKVEEFVPERMKVEAKTTEDGYLPDSEVNVNVEAEYLFGGSAEGSNVELTCRIEPTDFAPKKRRDYTFGLAGNRPGALDLGVESGTLGEDGTTTVSCPKPSNVGALQMTGRIRATAAVFEAGSGRTSIDEASALIHPEPYYIGLKSKGTKAGAGSSFTVDGLIVDWDGEVSKKVDEVEVEFIRLDREYYWYYSDDEFEQTWGQNIRPVSEGKRTVAVKNGKFRISGTPGRDSHGYVVRVKAGGAITDYKFEGARRYGYWWYDENGSNDGTPRPGKPTHVSIETPKEMEIGEVTAFKFEVPFKGRMLVTAETNRVLAHEWHDVEPGTFDWRFTLAEFAPTLYVSATLIKDPHADSKEAFTPDRAFGVEPVRVKPSAQTHVVELSAPKTVEPNSKLTIDVTIPDPDGTPTFVTVAAIDEGILSLTDYKTPEPNKSLFAKRALGVTTFETIGWALEANSAGPTSSTGGGDDEWEEGEDLGDKGRVMPIKPVALWSGLVPVDTKTGKAKVTFEVPRYRGALRVMAVVASGSRTGSAETKVTVRDPLVLQTTLPRFLSAGDEIHVPVFVTNMTGKPGAAEVTMRVESEPTPGLEDFGKEGAIVSFVGPATKSVTLAKDQSGTVVFALRGLRQAGTAKFRVEAKLGAISSWDEGIVPFRPSGPRERIVKTIELRSGENDLSAHLEGWVPTSENSTIWVTSNPYGESFDHLKYLVRYPYGCIEQTTASTRPLLFVSQFVDLIDPELVPKRGSIEDMVKHGINRILAMQTPSGGFSYWPGGSTPDAWGTAFATHMLLDAKDQSFDVPSDRLDRAIRYLEKTVDDLERDRGHDYYRFAEEYAHFVLARAGKAKKARASRLVEELPKKLKGRDLERAYMLWAALYLGGDRRYEKNLKSVDLETLTSTREGRFSYYSDQRLRGFVLSTFHDLFGKDAAGERLAKQVGENLARKRSYYYTTQELTWGITGLGKWVQEGASQFDVPALEVDGKRVKPQAAPKKRNDRSWAINRASEYSSISVNVANTNGKVYALISSEGVRKAGEPAYGGQGLKIARTFYNYEGDEIEPDGHELGDVVFTRITIKNTSERTLYNLAMVDRFAGGWEVENPRLGRGTLPEWVEADELWNVDHMNIRDDRVEVFGAIPAAGEVSFVYAVRSVSSGAFFAPPPEVVGMYDPEVWARAQPARVTIVGPWAEFLN